MAGRRTRLTHADGFYVDQDYLVTGETWKLRENGATSGVGLLATYAYDDLGRRTSLTRGNGTVKSYAYDAVSRLSSLGEDLAGTGSDLTQSFTYNPASQIATATRSNDSYAWTDHYNLTRNYGANGLNQYISSGSVTPTYDAKGNLTSAGGATYAYSSENLLTSASGGIALAYDPMLRLYQTSDGIPGTTRFAYDGADLIAEYNGSNAMLRRYVHGPGDDEPLVWYEGRGTTDRRFLRSDERGSVIATSNSSGTTLSTNAYDEYGLPKSTNSGRFQYTGQTWLPELGMYYYKARIYSPTLGRFLQTDRIGYGDGMNMYAYVGGDPINFIDPLGLEDEPYVCGGIRYNGDCISHRQYLMLRSLEQILSEVRAAVSRGLSSAGNESPPTGPPLPPDPCNARLPDGSTVNKNVDKIKQMIIALSDLGLASDGKSAGPMPPVTAFWLSSVREGGTWDYKIQPGGSQRLGNLNFGATGILLLPLDILRRGAAAVQDPASASPGHWYDRSPSTYGDQLSDIPAIIRGATQCKGTQ
jgi:RHS repeat-associated protein